MKPHNIISVIWPCNSPDHILMTTRFAKWRSSDQKSMNWWTAATVNHEAISKCELALALETDVLNIVLNSRLYVLQ